MTDFFGSANEVRTPVLFLFSTVKEALCNFVNAGKKFRKEVRRCFGFCTVY